MEFAVSLPPILMIIFATIEGCSAIFLNQTLHIASYEGVRVGIDPNAQSSDVTAKCEEILESRGVLGAVINIQPADVSEMDRGDQLAVSVTAPLDSNLLVIAGFYKNRSVTGSCTMLKE